MPLFKKNQAFICLVFFYFLLKTTPWKFHRVVCLLWVNIYCSISKFSERKTSSSKNSVSDIWNPFASIITVLNVTVLFLPFIMHCILPCCMPDSRSKRYWDILFSCNNAEMRFATASFTVTAQNSFTKFFCRYAYIYIVSIKPIKYRKVCLHNLILQNKENI